MNPKNSHRHSIRTHRRLIVEPLESRTVMSATNLLATAFDGPLALDLGIERAYRPAMMAPTSEVHAVGVPAPFARQLAVALPIASTWRPAPQVGIDPILRSGDLSSQTGRAQFQTLQFQTVDSSITKVDFPTVPNLFNHVSLSLSLGSTDMTLSIVDVRSRMERPEQRVSISLERFEQLPVLGIDAGRVLWANDRQAQGGLIDIIANRTQLAFPFRDRFFDSLGGASQGEVSQRQWDGRAPASLNNASPSDVTPSSLTSENSSASFVPAISLQPSHARSNLSIRNILNSPHDALTLPAAEYARHDPLIKVSPQVSPWHEPATPRREVSRDVAESTISASPLQHWLSSSSSRANHRPAMEVIAMELELEQDEHLKSAKRFETKSWLSDEAWWQGTLRRSGDSFWLEFSEDIDSRDREPRWNHHPRVSHPTDHIVVATTEITGDEGGMIELPAMVGAIPERCIVSTTTRPELVGKVQIDTGLGMFQVFEIANSPRSFTEATDLTVNESLNVTPASGVPATETLIPTSPTSVISEDVDAEPIHAASLSALLAAASLLFTRAPRPERQQVISVPRGELQQDA